MGLKKITSKKLENGDTFATRIEDKNSPYYGQYLIFICFKDEFWLNYWPKSWYDESYSTLFRIKITKDNKIPRTKEEIDSLEFIISEVYCIERAHYPLMGSMTYEELIESHNFQELHPDEYGYLNEYLNELWYSRKSSIFEYEYLGNFNIEKPKDEFISFGCNMQGIFWDQIINKSVKHYNDYNKRESCIYTSEENKKWHEQAQKMLEFDLKTDEYIRNLTEEEIKNFQPKYISGWGPGLYDSDVALDVKEVYLKVYDKNKTNREVMNQLLKDLKDFIEDSYDGPTTWMVIADLQMKRKRMDKKLKDIVLDCIDIDLSYWERNEQYEERKKELDKLKKRVENYKLD